MKLPHILLTYAIFFCSGAAALMYELIWTRYLTLVFGGSHLAVTTVLTVFMAGLALGSWVFGRRIDDRQELLGLFGRLELGIGASALLFLGLMTLYPPIYAALARIAPESPLYLSVVRFGFALLALIVPTTLMGGTLPVLTAFTNRIGRQVGVRLSLLYGCNTLGAVTGAAVTGFVILRCYSTGRAVLTALAINLVVGVTALLLQRIVSRTVAAGDVVPVPEDEPVTGQSASLSSRLVLWGIGISGFCAMGYEVLWNRVLIVAVGASSYGFTLLLMAFLSGIGLGSMVYGLVSSLRSRLRRGAPLQPRRAIAAFGVVQLLIGASALLAPEGLKVSETAREVDGRVMLLATIACWPLMASSRALSRLEGSVLFGGYLAYTAWLVLDARKSEALPAYRDGLLFYGAPILGLLVGVSAIRAVAELRRRAVG
jgi:spermidine synthase